MGYCPSHFRYCISGHRVHWVLSAVCTFPDIHKKEKSGDIMNLVILLVIGFTAGILGGLFGIGGAVVIIPALVLALGYSQYEAQGTTLLMLVLPVSSLAAWHYYRNGYVDVKAALILGVMFFIGGYIGARLAIHIPIGILKKIFAVILVLIALKLFLDKVH
jgi:uncharacterized membrane protein YfcA